MSLHDDDDEMSTQLRRSMKVYKKMTMSFVLGRCSECLRRVSRSLYSGQMMKTDMNVFENRCWKRDTMRTKKRMALNLQQEKDVF